MTNPHEFSLDNIDHQITKIYKLSPADFIEKSINNVIVYSEILDTSGTDNIIFSKASGSWSYVLVDAMYPSSPLVEGRFRQDQILFKK